MRIVWLLLLLTWTGAARADLPLVAELQGDLWSWNGDWKRLSTWGANFGPVRSPDQPLVAYFSYPQQQWSCEADCYPTNNVWIMDLPTGKAKRIADQPPGFTEVSGFVRRGLAWSPDSTQLAWLEEGRGDPAVQGNPAAQGSRLVLYNVATGGARRLKVYRPAYAQDSLLWTTAGLSYRAAVSDQDNRLVLYSPAGKLLSSRPYDSAAPLQNATLPITLRCPPGEVNCQISAAQVGVSRLPDHLVVQQAALSDSRKRAALIGLNAAAPSGSPELWLYEAGKLRKLAWPPLLGTIDRAELSWSVPIPVEE